MSHTEDRTALPQHWTLVDGEDGWEARLSSRDTGGSTSGYEDENEAIAEAWRWEDERRNIIRAPLLAELERLQAELAEIRRTHKPKGNRDNCGCCRKCGATVPCPESEEDGECIGACYCGMPEDASSGACECCGCTPCARKDAVEPDILDVVAALTAQKAQLQALADRRLRERDAEREDIDALRHALDLRMGEGLTLEEITAHVKALGVTGDHIKAVEKCIADREATIRVDERGRAIKMLGFYSLVSSNPSVSRILVMLCACGHSVSTLSEPRSHHPHCVVEGDHDGRPCEVDYQLPDAHPKVEAPANTEVEQLRAKLEEVMCELTATQVGDTNAEIAGRLDEAAVRDDERKRVADRLRQEVKGFAEAEGAYSEGGAHNSAVAAQSAAKFINHAIRVVEKMTAAIDVAIVWTEEQTAIGRVGLHTQQHNGLHVVWINDPDGSTYSIEHPDDNKAKRLAIALAREIQRGEP